jgi:hypothetical protein
MHFYLHQKFYSCKKWVLQYASYLFNLHHNANRTIIQQRMRLVAYEERAVVTLREMEGLRHENDILRRGTLPSSDQDRELQVTYHHLSEDEHGWNYTCQQLNLTPKEVDTRTHVIIHLKNAFETYGAKLEEMAMTIATLE